MKILDKIRQFFSKKKTSGNKIFKTHRHTVRGSGLCCWGLDDSQEVNLLKLLPGDISKLRTGDVVYLKNPARCSHFDSEYTLMRFVGFFDLIPKDNEDGLKKITEAENNPYVFTHIPNKVELCRWFDFFNKHYNDMPGMSKSLWIHLCQDFEKVCLYDKKYPDINYHKLGVVCVKYGYNNPNYFIVPSEWLKGVVI